MYRCLLLVLVLCVIATAQERNEATTLKTMVERIKYLKGDERRKAMNDLKLYLKEINLKRKEEIVAILKQAAHKSAPGKMMGRGSDNKARQPSRDAMQHRGSRHGARDDAAHIRMRGGRSR